MFDTVGAVAHGTQNSTISGRKLQAFFSRLPHTAKWLMHLFAPPVEACKMAWTTAQGNITRAWVKVYVLLPLAPAVVGAIIRCLFAQEIWTWQIISPAEISLSVGLLSLFVSQSVMTRCVPLEDEIGRQIRLGFVSEFQFWAFMSLILFALASVASTLEPSRFAGAPERVLMLDVLVVLTATLTISRCVVAQKTFKLAVS